MIEYPKIQSLFKRDPKTFKFLEDTYALPEFEYLKDNLWVWTEKIDGTNIRVDWDNEWEMLSIYGKTNNAQIPTFLVHKLHEIFTVEKFKSLFPETKMTLYGEGYGARIQKGGGNYIPDGVDFIMFDIIIDNWWLRRTNMEDIVGKLETKVVPIMGMGTLGEAIECTRSPYVYSKVAANKEFQIEGLVCKPAVELRLRNGHRVITKMKHKDLRGI